MRPCDVLTMQCKQLHCIYYQLHFELQSISSQLYAALGANGEAFPTYRDVIIFLRKQNKSVDNNFKYLQYY